MYAERCGGPAGVGRMATHTIVRQRQTDVIRVGGFIKIQRMAGRTFGRRTSVAVSMALDTIRRQVCPRQRKVCGVVVKTAVRIARGVAGEAGGVFISIPHDPLMPVVRFRVQVADDATVRGIVVRIGMAFRALVPDALVFAAVNGKILPVVRCELCRSPVGVGGVALGAVVGKIRQHVVRIESSLKIGLVAGKAGIRRVGKIAPGMAGGAVVDGMPLREREK